MGVQFGEIWVGRASSGRFIDVYDSFYTVCPMAQMQRGRRGGPSASAPCSMPLSALGKEDGAGEEEADVPELPPPDKRQAHRATEKMSFTVSRFIFCLLIAVKILLQAVNAQTCQGNGVVILRCRIVPVPCTLLPSLTGRSFLFSISCF